MNAYILNERGEPERSDDLGAFALWFAEADRCVAKDEIDGALVSTCFLAFDHSITGDEPVLWETMIFGGPLHLWCRRYTSRDEAQRGHALAVEEARAAQNRNRPHPEG